MEEHGKGETVTESDRLREKEIDRKGQGEMVEQAKGEKEICRGRQ